MFNSSYTAVGERIETMVSGQEYGPDVRKMVLDYAINSNDDTKTASEKLYDALSDRYPLRTWFVVVYKHNKDYSGSFFSSADADDNNIEAKNKDTPNMADWEHQFDSTFTQGDNADGMAHTSGYWVKNPNPAGKHAAAMSFPTGLQTEKLARFDETCFNEIKKFACNKDNQQSAQNIVNDLHSKVNSSCPGGVNVGTTIKRYCEPPCLKGTEKWHDASWAAFNYDLKFLDLYQIQCNSENGGLSGFDYEPYVIHILPPTFPFTAPENEFAYFY